jgi:hypothetical protein
MDEEVLHCSPRNARHHGRRQGGADQDAARIPLGAKTCGHETRSRAQTLTWRALLQALPLPDEAAGFATLTQQQWAQLAPLVVTLLTLVWLTSYRLPAPRAKPACVVLLLHCAGGCTALRCGCGVLRGGGVTQRSICRRRSLQRTRNSLADTFG